MKDFDVNKPTVPALATGLQQIVNKNLTLYVRVQIEGNYYFFNSRGNSKECIIYAQGHLQELCELETK